mgnify:CR=1 FL=1
MANTQLIPGRRYVATASGASPVTLTKQQGALDVARAALLPRVGTTAALLDGTVITSDVLQQVGVTDGSLDFAPLGVSVKSGATAALRRIVNTAATGPAAPTAATDGYSVQGASTLHVVMKPGAGVTEWELYAYDAVSGGWALFLDFGTAGLYTPTASATTRVILPISGVDRISLRVKTNAGLVQCDGWALAVY